MKNKKYNSRPIDTVTVTEVSQVTGEIKEYEKCIYDELTVQKEREYIKRKDEFNMIREEYFGKYYSHFFNKLAEINIPNQMKTRFLFLCAYMNYEDGYLVEEKESYKNKLTKKDLFNLLGLGKNEFAKTIKVLIENELIYEEDDTYKINNTYAVKGEVSNKKLQKGNFIRVFDKGIKELYLQCEPIQHKRLYYLFAILPYINMKYNVVSYSNPSEENYNDIAAMSMSDICELVGYDPKNTKRLWNDLKALTINEKYVIKKVEGGDGEFIKINPSVYYGGTSNQVDGLKYLMADFGYQLYLK